LYIVDITVSLVLLKMIRQETRIKFRLRAIHSWRKILLEVQVSSNPEPTMMRNLEKQQSHGWTRVRWEVKTL
jgi:hypothetical protein